MTIGQEGPRTEEKWRMSGIRLGLGRAAIMTADLVVRGVDSSDVVDCQGEKALGIDSIV